MTESAESDQSESCCQNDADDFCIDVAFSSIRLQDGAGNWTWGELPAP
jgi:hypothetical protein